MNFRSFKSKEETKQLISEKYLEGDYDHCMALVVDQLNSIRSYINYGQSPHKLTSPRSTTTLLHNC